jgi:hypothetical protein
MARGPSELEEIPRGRRGAFGPRLEVDDVILPDTREEQDIMVAAAAFRLDLVFLCCAFAFVCAVLIGLF